MAAGTAFTAAGQMQAGQAAKQQANYNAAIQRQQAQQVLQNQKFQEYQQKKINKQKVSSQLAQIGKSGILMEGTPVALVSRTMAEQELDLLNKKYNADIKANELESAALLTEFEGSQIQKQKQGQAIGTLLSGGASFGTKYGDLYGG